MQALMNSQCNTTTSGVCELRNEITLLKINLEEEKSRNMYLECDVKRLQLGIEIIHIEMVHLTLLEMLTLLA